MERWMDSCCERRRLGSSIWRYCPHHGHWRGNIDIAVLVYVVSVCVCARGRPFALLLRRNVGESYLARNDLANMPNLPCVLFDKNCGTAWRFAQKNAREISRSHFNIQCIWLSHFALRDTLGIYLSWLSHSWLIWHLFTVTTCAMTTSNALANNI